ncbi:MAG TPA: hypothetical protein VGU43_05570 [Thermoplasmata archaeon]|nr:hypothetical protein [Thermoplasmata archaeon]
MSSPASPTMGEAPHRPGRIAIAFAGLVVCALLLLTLAPAVDGAPRPFAHEVAQLASLNPGVSGVVPPAIACEARICPHQGGAPNWSSLSGTPSPSAREGPAVAFDDADGYLVLFGGYEGYARPHHDLNDTWIFRAGVWQPISPPVSPSARSQAALVTDPATGCLLLFGGRNDSSGAALGDTWRFCGDLWASAGSSGPSARYAASAAADPACSCVLLFGGRASAAGSALNDTWRFSAGAWSAVSSASSPPARSDAEMAWDGAVSALILYGGRNASGANVLADTWGYSTLGWQLLTPTLSPGPRADYGLLALPAGAGVQLFGGSDGSNDTNDTWTYASGGWVAVPSAGAPPARSAAGYAFDPADNYTLVFGGENSSARPTLWYGDTWVAGGVFVQFTESGLPPATTWSVTLNGSTNSSSLSTIGFEVGGGSYSFLTSTVVGKAYGVRFLPSRAIGTIHVESGPIPEAIGYAEQVYLRTFANPAAAGFTSPVTEWVAPSTAVEIDALPIPGYHFAGWTGLGPGNYSGPADPANLTLTGGVNETAAFSPATTYPVRFSETGLPGSADWTVTLNGVPYPVGGSNLTLPLTDGSYAWSASASPPGLAGLRYTPSPASGNLTIAGGGAHIVVAFQLWALLNSSIASGGNGAIAPASGWYPVGASITLLAEAGSGYQFNGWKGSGPGSYTGDSPGVSIVIGGPVSEVASFGATGAGSLWSATNPIWLTIALVFLVGAVAVVATIVLLGTRRARAP